MGYGPVSYTHLVMRSQLLNSRTVRLDGLGTFTMKARTRGCLLYTSNE